MGNTTRAGVMMGCSLIPCWWLILVSLTVGESNLRYSSFNTFKFCFSILVTIFIFIHQLVSWSLQFGSFEVDLAPQALPKL